MLVTPGAPLWLPLLKELDVGPEEVRVEVPVKGVDVLTTVLEPGREEDVRVGRLRTG